MKQLLCLLFLFLISISAFTDDTTSTKKILRYYNPNARYKNIMEEYEVNENNENIKNGSYKYYSENGDLIVEGAYKNNKKTGIWITYSYGTIFSVGEFRDDLAQDKWIFYYGTNKIKSVGNFLNNKKYGIWKNYRLDGKLSSEINFDDNGLYDGQSKFYYSNSAIQIIGNYIHGKKEGDWIHYFENGNIRCKIKYKNNTECDTSYSYCDDKSLQKEIYFKDTFFRNSKSYYPFGKIKTVTNTIDTSTNKYQTLSYYENGQLKSDEIFNDSMIFYIKYYGKKGEELDNGTYTNGNGLLIRYDDDTLISETYYKNFRKDGGVTMYHHNKNISAIGQYKDDARVGEWIFYKEDGIVTNKTNYDLSENAGKQPELYDSTNNNKIYDRCETMPSFENGIPDLMKFLAKNIRYPSIARENGLEGKVIIKFYVDDLGNINGSKILRDGVGGGAAEEALRVVDILPRWNPGYQEGFPVNVYYTLPVTFKLQ